MSHASGSGVSSYRLWFEIYPMQVAQYAYPFTISRGDRLFVEAWNDGGDTYFYIADN